MKKQPKHFINVLVPIAHRMNYIPKGSVNKYRKAEAIANRIHRNSVGGGGYGFDHDYDIAVYMPANKVATFKAALRENGIRYKDYGEIQEY